MTYQHKELAAGRWQQLSFVEAMANIGSEVERAIKWRNKNNVDYSRRAADRALELLELTTSTTTRFSRLKEVTRTREAIIDYFYGENEYKTSDIIWQKYFSQFNYAARNKN